MTKNASLPALAVLALGTLALAGCSGGSESADEGGAESEVVAADGSPQPGRWEAKLTLTKIEVDEPDSEMAEFFEGAQGQTHEYTSCLTPEQAAKPQADFFQGEESGCTYDSFTMSGGKIASELTCDNTGATMKVSMTGTYTPDSYEISSTAKGDIMPETPGTMAMTATGKRVGDCTGDEAA